MPFSDLYFGRNPPFLLKSILKQPQSIIKKPIEAECSSFTISSFLEINTSHNETERIDCPFEDFFISGFIKNGNVKIPILIKRNKKIITQSCFDIIILYFYQLKTAKIFSVRFGCCSNFDEKTIKATEIKTLENYKHFDLETHLLDNKNI